MNKLQEHLKKFVVEQAEYRNSQEGHLKYYDCPICKKSWFYLVC